MAAATFMSLDVHHWTRLCTLLDSAIESEKPSPDLINRIDNALEAGRPQLEDLLVYPTPHPSDAEALKSGSVYIPGKPSGRKPLREELKREAELISRTLHLSEIYSAGLLLESLNEKTGRGIAETAVKLFYEERLNMLQCLYRIFLGSTEASDEDVKALLYEFSKKLVNEKRGPTSWVVKLLKAIDQQQELLSKLTIAPSQTVPSIHPFGASLAAPPAPVDAASLGPEITQFRRLSITELRQRLAEVLYGAATLAIIQGKDIIEIIKWLSQCRDATDATATHMVIAALTALNLPLDTSNSNRRTSNQGFSNDRTISSALREALISIQFLEGVQKLLSGTWPLVRARSVLRLQWALFVMESKKLNTTLTDKVQWSELRDPIQEGALEVMRRDLLAFKRQLNQFQDEEDDLRPRLSGGETSQSANRRLSDSLASVAPWFQQSAVLTIESITISLVINGRDLIRKLKREQEDVRARPSRSNVSNAYRSRRGIGEDTAAVLPKARQNIEELFLLIASLYRNAPDTGAKFWGDDESLGSVAPKLFQFVKSMADCTMTSMQGTYLEMLIAISTGEKCSAFAFDFLGGASPGDDLDGLSWQKLFAAVDGNIREMDAGRALSPEAYFVLKPFFRLLSSVVRWSPVARVTIFDSRYKPLFALLRLAMFGVPIDLKGEILNSISAFCAPGSPKSIDIARQTWLAIENSQILPTIPSSLGGIRQGPPAKLGIRADLEEVEAQNGVYPTSIAFVDLMSQLIQSPLKGTLSSIGEATFDTRSIPEGLGYPNREPGLGPYVTFVIDEVFLKCGTSERRGVQFDEVWRVLGSCINFLERCLNAFDLENLLAGFQGESFSQQALLSLLNHPGFLVIARLLGDERLLQRLCTVIDQGASHTEVNQGIPPDLEKSVSKTLNLLLRLSELQPLYLELLLPALRDSKKYCSAEILALLGSAQALDIRMAWDASRVINIFRLINWPGSNHILVNTLRLITFISKSPYFNASNPRVAPLPTIIVNSSYVNQILMGFCNAIQTSGDDDTNSSGDDFHSIQDGLALSDQVLDAVLDLLIENTSIDSVAPNVSHLLLGFEEVRRNTRRSEVEIVDTPGPGAQCFHAILNLLSDPSSAYDNDSEDEPLLLRISPTIAQKSYQLISQLCTHEFSASATGRFLRGQSNFLVKQALELPLSIPSRQVGLVGRVLTNDGQLMNFSCEDIVSGLHSQAWILESLSLEIKSLADAESDTLLDECVISLFVPQNLASRRPMPGATAPDQALSRIVDTFTSFFFEWRSAKDIGSKTEGILGGVSYDTCLKFNSDGCEIYDLSSVISLLGLARLELNKQGALSTTAQNHDFLDSCQAVVERIEQLNAERELSHARAHCIRAWRSVVSIVLLKAMKSIPDEDRQELLLELLGLVLAHIEHPALQSSPEVQHLLSSTAVLIGTKLRAEAIRLPLQDVGEQAMGFTTDRLHGVLRLAIDAIVQPQSSQQVRGNLYAVLLNYLQHSEVTSIGQNSSIFGLDLSAAGDETSVVERTSSLLSTKRALRRNKLASGNASIFEARLDRLLHVLARDAAVGFEAYRTVAFTLLAAILEMNILTGSEQKFTQLLVKNGYLQNFIQFLRDAQPDLAEATGVNPSTGALGTIYIYQVLMAFLTRIASTRLGAEQLLDAQILPILSQCESLSALSVQDIMVTDGDAFLASPAERYHQVLMPTLELCNSLLSNLGANNVDVTRQALAFLNEQRDSLLYVIGTTGSAPTLTFVQETRLIANIMSFALSQTADEAMSPSSGFGALNNALLILSSAFLADPASFSRIPPTTSSEREDSGIAVADPRGPTTIFMSNLIDAIDNAAASITEYMQLVTRRKGPTSFYPVLTPSLRMDGISGRPPTLGHIFAFARDMTTLLLARLETLRRISETIEHLDDVDANVISEFVPRSSLDEDHHVARARASREIVKLGSRARSDCVKTLHLVENALLLIWRHLRFWLTDDQSASPSSDALWSKPARKSTPQQIRALRSDADRIFRSIVSKLDGIVLSRDALQSTEARTHDALLESLLRSIKGVLNLNAS